MRIIDLRVMERGPSNQVVGSSTTAPRSDDGDRPIGRPRAQARGEGPQAPKQSLRACKSIKALSRIFGTAVGRSRTRALPASSQSGVYRGGCRCIVYTLDGGFQKRVVTLQPLARFLDLSLGCVFDAWRLRVQIQRQG
jgi:hypothetical protein